MPRFGGRKIDGQKIDGHPSLMTRSTRQLLAVVAVTAALCADQVVAAAPANRTEAGQAASLASRFVNRLSQSFRRTVAAALPRPAAEAVGPVCPGVRRLPNALQAPVLHPTLSPFEFRLPPPAA